MVVSYVHALPDTVAVPMRVPSLYTLTTSPAPIEVTVPFKVMVLSSVVAAVEAAF